ncbi:MAG: cell envelope integrity EipB family protein [Kiloniellales bacterium]
MHLRPAPATLFFVLLTAAPTGSALAAPKVEVVPHRALYEMSLVSASRRSGIIGVSGGLAFEWAETCDGWTVEQRYKLHLLYSGGSEMEVRTSYASWESKDGLGYRFNLRNQRGGVTDEEYRGSATLEAKGEAGSARYTKPEDRTEPLPAGTVFPTEHTELLIERARAGQRMFLRPVFDGTTEHGTMLINAFIGEPLEVADLPEEPLTNVKGWRMRLAFFPLDTGSESPEYEVGLELQENGIARSVVLDYGDFTIRGVLAGLERLPRPGC